MKPPYDTEDLGRLLALYYASDRGLNGSPFGLLLENDSVRVELMESLDWDAWDEPDVDVFRVSSKAYEGTSYLQVSVSTRSRVYTMLAGQPRLHQRTIRLHDLVIFLRDGATAPSGWGLQVHHINNHHGVNRADNLLVVIAAIHQAFHRIIRREGGRELPRASWLQLRFAAGCSITATPSFEAPCFGAAPW